MATTRFFLGAPGEEILAWFCLVDSELKRLQLYGDEMQADYGWQGLKGDAVYSMKCCQKRRNGVGYALSRIFFVFLSTA